MAYAHLTFRIPVAMLEQLKRLATKEDRSVSSLLRNILQHRLHQMKEKAQ